MEFGIHGILEDIAPRQVNLVLQDALPMTKPQWDLGLRPDTHYSLFHKDLASITGSSAGNRDFVASGRTFFLIFLLSVWHVIVSSLLISVMSVFHWK